MKLPLVLAASEERGGLFVDVPDLLNVNQVPFLLSPADTAGVQSYSWRDCKLQ